MPFPFRQSVVFCLQNWGRGSRTGVSLCRRSRSTVKGLNPYNMHFIKLNVFLHHDAQRPFHSGRQLNVFYLHNWGRGSWAGVSLYAKGPIYHCCPEMTSSGFEPCPWSTLCHFHAPNPELKQSPIMSWSVTRKCILLQQFWVCKQVHIRHIIMITCWWWWHN